MNFVEDGGSKAEAARRFEVGEASVHRWVRKGRDWMPAKPGRPVGHGDKLDREELMAAIAAQPDLMLKELAAMFEVSITAVHHACKMLGLVRKKTTTYRKDYQDLIENAARHPDTDKPIFKHADGRVETANGRDVTKETAGRVDHTTRTSGEQKDAAESWIANLELKREGVLGIDGRAIGHPRPVLSIT